MYDIYIYIASTHTDIYIYILYKWFIYFFYYHKVLGGSSYSFPCLVSGVFLRGGLELQSLLRKNAAHGRTLGCFCWSRDVEDHHV